MDEVSGPVVAIALILAAVFIPTAAIPGITGRLYQQFAITIAISVLISAFNALTLSQALAALVKGKADTALPEMPVLKTFEQTKRDLSEALKPLVEALTQLEAPLENNLLVGLTKEPDLFFSPRAVRANRCFLKGQLPMDERGYLLTGALLPKDGDRPKGWKEERDPFIFESIIPGVFAAGDTRHASIKRVASAVGEGSITVQMVHQYLAKVR